ncbi:uncharacterized protein F54H12.2-like [Stegodyphus dumicola]|uniref:uncharacterized protein F54H12.2-like n=1 Tax=Stegodyphus dumicola TaxID=202533 RepID=UPI0015B0F15F|nr:uncharacterized protein F54H12.2-like [Stegodyphus dumicola]
MAFLLKDAKSELKLFTLHPTQTVIERGQWVQFHPLSNASDGGPIEFHVSGTREDYLDLSQTQLFLKVKVVISDGSLLKDGEKVDVTLNERLISSSNNTYPYRAILEKLLNHNYDEKTSQLSAELFFKDTAGKMNVFDPSDPNPNEGFTKRADFIKKSETVDMIGRLHVDLFHQERLMLNLVDLKLKLIRSKLEFCLMGENSYKILIQHASLFVRKVRVNPAVTLAHAKSLEKTSAKYPINRVLCKIYSIPQGNMSFVQDNVFAGQMPKRLVLAFVDNEALNGTYKKSRFEFKHYHINFISVYMDGQPVPYQPLEPNFENNAFIRAYQSLFLSAKERIC